MSNANQEWGAEAEEIAENYLVSKGYAILERNYRKSNHIEIDIIAQLGMTMVFVEVKARKGDHQLPLEAVDKKKIRRIVLGADSFLRKQSALFNCRFDIIAILGTRENYNIQHYESAFLPPLFTKK